ncbi:MAG TPA: FMN-binding protein [Clostridia bacterium]|nr:FMN-binding protein [Clostridia bacterium]
MKKILTPSVKCVLTLVIIAVVCVAALAILNDLLYVPPDFSAFSNAYTAEYDQVEVADVALQNGKVLLAVEGNDSQGKELVGLYIESNGYGKAKAFTVIIILEKDTGTILSSYIKEQGNSGPYEYDESKLAQLTGTNIADIDAKDPEMVITGATHSSYAVLNAFATAKEYYQTVYGE